MSTVLFFIVSLFFFFFFFFFSSRRRHTRLVSDWSSDVYSSDLKLPSRRLACPHDQQLLECASAPRYHPFPGTWWESLRPSFLLAGVHRRRSRLPTLLRLVLPAWH